MAIQLLKKKHKEKATLETNQVDNVLDYITPVGLEFKNNEIIIGENRAKCYGIISYPQKVEYGWLSKLTNIPGTVASITYEPVDSGEFINNVSDSIKRFNNDAMHSTEPLERLRASRASQDGEKIIESIDAENQSVGHIGVQIMPLAKDDKSFEKSCRATESRVSALGCRSRVISSVQKNAFKSLSPFYVKDEVIDNILQRVIPMNTFMGGYPFSTSGYSDGAEAKYTFAHDSMGGLVNIDFWKRGGDRTNSNFTVLGVPGVGKSTVVKFIAQNEYMMGTKIIFVDPEGEYIEMTRNLNGDVINAGGGLNGLINPLQIRNSPAVDEEDEQKGLGPLALHLQMLDVFFSLYIESLSDIQKALLKSTLIELYKNCNISWDTDITNLKNEDFPIMGDLFVLLVEKAKIDSNYKDLAILIEDIATGGDSFLFGRHSSLSSDSRCICLNTASLQNSNDNVKKAQYFNLLTYCWYLMSYDRNEKVLLICDEAYLMIDEKVPQSLIFLRNVSKRARKYEAGLGIVSHSVVDFLAPSIKQYGQALLDNPCYKILMGSDGQNLEELKKLYNLTEAEESLIASKQRGTAVGMFGSSRLSIRFVIPQYKLELMGSSGGR